MLYYYKKNLHLLHYIFRLTSFDDNTVSYNYKNNVISFSVLRNSLDSDPDSVVYRIKIFGWIRIQLIRIRHTGEVGVCTLSRVTHPWLVRECLLWLTEESLADLDRLSTSSDTEDRLHIEKHILVATYIPDGQLTKIGVVDPAPVGSGTLSWIRKYSICSGFSIDSSF